MEQMCNDNRGKLKYLVNNMSVPLAWFYLYGNRLDKHGVKNPKSGK